jgi:hypothetical protein
MEGFGSLGYFVWFLHIGIRMKRIIPFLFALLLPAMGHAQYSRWDSTATTVTTLSNLTTVAGGTFGTAAFQATSYFDLAGAAATSGSIVATTTVMLTIQSKTLDNGCQWQ